MVDIKLEEIQQDTIYALAKSGHMLYAAQASGLYRSRDNGNTWEDAAASSNSFIAASVATDGNTIIVGANGAVLRSEDAGGNWQITGLTSPLPLVLTIAISPNNAEIIAAGTAEDGVFISTDRGATWAAWNFGLIDLNVYSLVISPHFERDRTVFAGTESGIFRSHNGGRSWRETSFPMDAAPVVSLCISPDTARIHAGTEENGLFVSDDFGASWQHIENDLISGSINAIQAIDALTSPEVCLLLEDRLIYSSDSSHSWKIHRTFAVDQTAMTMLILPDAVLVGFSNGDIVKYAE